MRRCDGGPQSRSHPTSDVRPPEWPAPDTCPPAVDRSSWLSWLATRARLMGPGALAAVATRSELAESPFAPHQVASARGGPRAARRPRGVALGQAFERLHVAPVYRRDRSACQEAGERADQVLNLNHFFRDQLCLDRISSRRY